MKFVGPWTVHGLLFTENWSKVAATVHVPYMNSSRKWGENVWKKKKKRENADTETQQTQSKHTLGFLFLIFINLRF